MKKKGIYAFVSVAVFLLIVASFAQGSDIQAATRAAEEKLKANHFLLTEEIDEIYEKEQTPNVWDKIPANQQKAIVAELKMAKEANTQKSLGFGLSIKDPLEQSIYQDVVLSNMMLKSSREIAKKYGIKAADVFMIELYLTMNRIRS